MKSNYSRPFHKLIRFTIQCLLFCVVLQFCPPKMPSCAAVFCSQQQGKGNERTFHRFPRDPQMSKQWVLNMRRDHWTPSTKSVLCSDHFTPQSFDKTGQTVRLQPGAVPTIFSFPNHLKKEKKTRKPPKNRGQEPTPEDDNLTELPSCSSTGSSSRSSTGPPSCSSTISEILSAIALDHCYFVKDSPRKLKRKMDVHLHQLEHAKKKLKISHQKEGQLKKRLTTMKAVITSLKGKDLITSSAAEVIQCTFTGAPKELFSRLLKNKESGKTSREQYPKELRTFACTLQFYSGRAYDFVREAFELALPHPSVIRKWFSSIKGTPGFSEEALRSLQEKVEVAKHKNKKVICSLMMDEMSTRKQIEWDYTTGKTYGYVDMGTGITDETLPPAKEALVLMLVTLDGSWKLPIAYFMVNGLTGEEKGNIVEECLHRCTSVGVHTVSLTCDGPSVNIAMMKMLGANPELPNPVPSFPNPADPNQQISIFLDVCHMIKLVRNALSTMQVIKDANGNKIKWYYIHKLNEIQQREGLREGNKLRNAHMTWWKQKMKVNLAIQTISSGVADTIESCWKDFKMKEFKGCEATVHFLRVFDRLFDVLNSRNPFGRGYKAPLRKQNEAQWRPFVMDALKYISGLTDVSGIPIYKTPYKTGFVGFCISALSAVRMYDNLVGCVDPDLKYLLTYKMSQDHLELFFGAVRARGGWNNNPTARQFMSAWKHLFVHHQIKTSTGNVIAQDDTVFLEVSSSTDTYKDGITRDTLDMTIAKQYDLQPREPEQLDHDYVDMPNIMKLSDFADNIVAYIAGFVSFKLLRILHCETCKYALSVQSDENKTYVRLISRKNRGKLVIPSQSVVIVCRETELCFRRLLKVTGNKPPQCEQLIPTISSVVLGEVVSNKNYKIFEELSEHMLECAVESNHVFQLIKNVVAIYSKVRMHHVAKTYTEEMMGEKVRKQFSKMILFRNQ